MCLATYNPGRVSLSRCGIPLWSTPSVLSGIADFLHTFYRPQSCPASPPSGRKGIPFHSIESASRLVRRFQAVHSWEEIPSNKSFVPSPSSSVCGMLENDEELGGGQKKNSQEGRVAKRVASASVSNLSSGGNMKNIPNMYTQILVRPTGTTRVLLRLQLEEHLRSISLNVLPFVDCWLNLGRRRYTSLFFFVQVDDNNNNNEI